MFTFDALADLPYRYGRPSVVAGFKQQPEDFLVAEQLGYLPPVAAQNEHLWLLLEKTGQNTQWLAEQLARFFGRPISDVSYAGLKDRHAITQQWFSLRLADAGRLPKLAIPNVRLLDSIVASKKLQRGALQANQFQIRLRDVTDLDALEQRFQLIKAGGVNNYFGPQRFGHHSSNLLLAERWRKKRYRPRGRQDKSFLISAMRAWLFNVQAAELGLNPDLEHGFLLGEMRFQPPAELEELLQPYSEQWAWLCRQGCKMQKRPLRLVPEGADLRREGGDALLTFSLPAGSYATTVLRELCLFGSAELS